MSEYEQTDNGERCSNCGTVNPVGQDKCTNCGQPLTASADEGLRTNIAATNNESIMGGRNDTTPIGGGETVFDAPDDPDRRDVDMPDIMNRPA